MSNPCNPVDPAWRSADGAAAQGAVGGRDGTAMCDSRRPGSRAGGAATHGAFGGGGSTGIGQRGDVPSNRRRCGGRKHSAEAAAQVERSAQGRMTGAARRVRHRRRGEGRGRRGL